MKTILFALIFAFIPQHLPSRQHKMNTKKKLSARKPLLMAWALAVAFAPFVHATEWGGLGLRDMEGDVSEWQRCRFPGIDVIGAAKLLSFHPLQTNEQGVVATFLFTDMLRGAPGEYTLTIPDDMRNPMKMTVDRGEWKWELAETYGILCLSNESHGIRMVDWVVPREKWRAFKANAEKERKRFEAYVKQKKLEYAKVEEKIDEIMERDDIEQEEQAARRNILNTRRTEIFIQVQDKAEPYFIINMDMDEPNQTWPIAVDEREQIRRMLGL